MTEYNKVFPWVVIIDGPHHHTERHWCNRRVARQDKRRLKELYATDKSITVTMWKITNVSKLFGDTKSVRFMEKAR